MPPPSDLALPVELVVHEITRHQTPTSRRLVRWSQGKRITLLPTKTFQHFEPTRTVSNLAPKKSKLGELAIQEAMNAFALMAPPKTGVFLFEDHKIARASFLLTENCRKLSTRTFLSFLEQRGAIESAAEIERRAVPAGRNFSSRRFPPD